MADVGPGLEHLLEGRAALVAEVDRLSAAIADLDVVISRLGGDGAASAAAPADPRRVPGRPAATSGERNGKSIRVHVLEMLAAEQREMGLAEIIDRVHAAGIRAHDDAVRSITIKLMKDGKVERVGRGHYRLADGAAPSVTRTEPSAPTVDVAAV